MIKNTGVILILHSGGPTQLSKENTGLYPGHPCNYLHCVSSSLYIFPFLNKMSYCLKIIVTPFGNEQHHTMKWKRTGTNLRLWATTSKLWICRVVCSHIWELLTPHAHFDAYFLFFLTEIQRISWIPLRRKVCAPLIWSCSWSASLPKQKPITYTLCPDTLVMQRHSEVWVMPPEHALICMRAEASLWCNCSSGEGQCLCPASAQYQSPDVDKPLRFLYGNLHAFWRMWMPLLIGVWK